MRRWCLASTLLVPGCLGTYTPVGNATDGGSGGPTGSDDGDTNTSTSDGGGTGGSDGDGTATPTEGTTGDGLVPCDAFLQDCPANEKCLVIDENGDGTAEEPRCVPSPGSGEPGEACTQSEDFPPVDTCTQESACLFADESGEGVCAPFCGPAPDHECPMGEAQICIVDASELWGACLLQCDPLDDTSCSELDGCYPVDADAGVAFVCLPLAPGDPALAMEPCAYQRDCESSTACVVDPLPFDCTGPGCCTPYCDVQQNDLCQTLLPTAQCTWVGNIWPGTDAPTTWGVCLAS